MSDSDPKDTQPNSASADTQPNLVAPAGKKNFPRWIAALLFLVLIAIGLLSGYSSGMGRRYSVQKTQVSGQLLDQFNLGVQAAATGQYQIAKQHFDSVIQSDPNYPGVKAAYADLLIRMQTTPTLTPSPSPTITPTADLRGVQDQFTSAQDLLKTGDWDGTISKLDSVRKLDPTYQTAQVDGMYYTALYQRGLSKILAVANCDNVNLEGGIYDLTLAERFGPLDVTADTLRTYARLYIAGSSFWDQDWKTAQDYFAQVMAAYPSMRDASCVSATERWRQATIKYAQELAAKNDFCGAVDQYSAAFAINSPDNSTVFPLATAVQDQCGGGGGDSSVQAPTETPTPGGEIPTLTPTPEPSVQPTDVPPETPTDTPSTG